ncbi:MAG TPA: hypothetical protein VNI20_07685, partial [Fimbriimonadaceae bacterium]|nr:hypothetical protein [Fimbriimonadaceae bacterium]
MRRIFAIGFGVLLGVSVLGQGRGGAGAGGFGGAAQAGAGQGGLVGKARYDEEVRRIENSIDKYLTADGVKNILTPGQFSQWKLKMKKGQVLIADATSDVFDPALQIVKLKEGEDEEAPGTVLKENDDRYPGDQRPLLLWHCDQDGEYMLRARCFRDKSGGQFSVRLQTYDSYDLPAGQSVDLTMNGPTRFLLRMQLKAGEIRAVTAGAVLDDEHVSIELGSVISPIGLPSESLIEPFRRVFENAVMAPVDGDYYMMAQTYYGNGMKLHV